MRVLFLLFGVGVLAFLGWVGFHQIPLYMASKDAFAIAEARIVERIESGRHNSLDFSDLDGLRVIPSQIGELSRLEALSLNNTNITDLTPLAGLKELKRLQLSQMPVSDLSPLANITTLENLVLHRSWAFDLSPLGQLRNLEDLNLAYTAVQSLEPLTALRKVRQLTLYSSYAHDGSKSHYEYFLNSTTRVNNGNSYKANYQPGWQYRAKIAFGRFVEKVTLGGPPTLK